MITFDANLAEVQALRRKLDGNAKEFRKQMTTVVNKTAAKTKSMIAKEVSKQLALPQKIVKKATSIKRAKNKVTAHVHSSIVTQRAFPNGFPLKMLSPMQTDAGVVFKVGRKKEVRLGAFIGPKPGTTLTKFKGHAFKRKGKSRLPIEKQFGPQRAIDAFNDAGTGPRAVKFAREQLKKEIIERTRFLGLKKSGAI
jgi:hypothetical protein